MESVKSFEKLVAGWMKGLPHLPKDLTRWLANNAWWLVLIGVVLGALAILPLIGLAGFGGVMVGSVLGAQVGGLFWLKSMVSVAVLIAVVVIQAIAISPLKEMKQKGWDLVFLALVVSFFGIAIADLIVFNIGGVVVQAIGTAIGMYVLLEVKQYFPTTAKTEPSSGDKNK